jgi:lipopolysaccharide export system permease protein
VLEYTSKASKNISFENIYAEGFRSQSFPSQMVVMNPKKNTEQETAFLANPPYFALSMVNDRTFRERILEITRTKIQQETTVFETTSSNILWRVKRINRYLVEIYKKFSIPFACVVFILLGAPIGMMTRRGNFGYAAIISTVILTVYWISIIQGEKMADRLFISPFIGMWAFNIVFSVVGIGLIVHLSTEFRLTRLFRKDD